jgi:hypothetical protein
MPPTKPAKLDGHTDAAYDACDILDWVAKHKGEHTAQVEASAGVADLLARYPKAEKALDPELVTRHKMFARFKDAGATPAMRFKEAPAIDPQIAQAAAQAQAAGFTPAVCAAALTALVQSRTPAATTKATKPRDGFMAAVEAVMNGNFETTDMRPSGR